ncbi:hypothetical protein ES708_16592 [subsurface metagenome]
MQVPVIVKRAWGVPESGEGCYLDAFNHVRKRPHTPRHFLKAPFLQREKAAYIKLKRIGLSINQISKAFGRSTSCIFRILKRAYAQETLRRFDMRKLPYLIRMRLSSFRWACMMKLLSQWEDWICGKSEEPP